MLNSQAPAGGDGVLSKKVRVSEDFPKREAKIHACLIPFLKKALEEGHEAYIKYDKLLVNGDTYMYDEIKTRPVVVSK